jgi:ABC-type polysaccharide/polyol phosphate transport system ATPase subunit
VTSRPPAVVVDGVSKQFRLQHERPASLKEKVTKLRFERKNEFWALRDVSLAVPAGSMFALVGHNGSGKSTLLRLIAGIYKPTTGRVSTVGRISALLELGAGFHPDLSGRENVYLNAAILGMTRKETDRLYASIVEFSGLEEFIDTPVRHYSSGMYMRLGFSVAVHVDPQILMVDEVIAVGDADFQRRCYEHFYKLRQKGTTIVIVTHGLGDVKSMCDEAAWLDHGSLRAVAPAPEIVTRYLDEVNRAEADRHERVAQAEAPPESEPVSAGALVIERIQVLGADGQPASLVTTGGAATIQVDYEIRKPVATALLSISVTTEQGLLLNATGPAQSCTLPTGLGRRAARYAIPHLPFGPGDYPVSARITDADGMVTLDEASRAAMLRVRPSAVEVNGLVKLDGAFELDPVDLDRAG